LLKTELSAQSATLIAQLPSNSSPT